MGFSHGTVDDMISERIVTPSLVIGLGNTGYQVLKHLSDQFVGNETFNHSVPPMVRLVNIDIVKRESEDSGVHQIVLEPFSIGSFEETGVRDQTKNTGGPSPAATEDAVTPTPSPMNTPEITATDGSVTPGLSPVETPEVAATDGIVTQKPSWVQTPTITSWLPGDILLKDMVNTRLSGRITLFRNIEQVLSELTSHMTEIMQKRHLTGNIRRTPDEVPANVYLVTSLCGKTDSGMFLDVAYIIRELFKRRGKKQPELQGYFFMAQAFEQASPLMMEEYTATMMASLKELDFFMENLEDFSVTYRKGIFYISDQVAKHKPFDFGFLISAIDISNLTTLIKVVGVSIFHAVATELGKGNRSYFSTVSAQAFKPVRTGPFKGRYSNFSSLGVSSFVFPYRRVIEMGACHFAAGVTDEILEFVKTDRDPKPWDPYLRDFLWDNHLYEDNRTLRFSENLLGGALPRKFSLVKYKKMNHDDKYRALVKEKKDIDLVTRALINGMKKNLEIHEEAFIGSLDTSLDEIMGNEDRGVRFALKFLTRLSTSLEQLLESQRTRRENAKRTYAVQAGEASRVINDLSYETKQFFLFRSKSIINELSQNYIESVNRATVSQLESEKASRTSEFIRSALKYIGQTINLLNRMEEILTGLLETFAQKGIPESLEGELFHEEESDWLLNDSVVSLDDIRSLYRDVVGEFKGFEAKVVGPDVLDMAHRWQHFCEHPEELEQLVLEYGRTLLEEHVTGMTIEAFLEEKKKRTIRKEFNLVGKNLGYEAKPLWNINTNLYSENLVFLNFLGVYDMENTLMLEHIVSYLPTKEPPHIVSTKDPHRITLVQTAHGAPLFALRGISAWEDMYENMVQEKPLHCITGEAYNIKWENYTFRPQHIETEQVFLYFSLACLFDFIQPLRWENKVQYFLCFDEGFRRQPERMQDLNLGRNRMEAFESFTCCPYVRKCKHLVDKRMTQLGCQRVIAQIEENIDKLNQHSNKLKDDKYQKFLGLEIKELEKFRAGLLEQVKKNTEGRRE